MYTSSISSNAKVDVFINFGGEVRGGFLSHLRHALARQSIKCFIDDEETERTETRKHVPAKVLHAISESKVAVVVLSENYASSSWCLNELVEIMKAKSMMVPVYYEVDISDVQYLKGSFGEDVRRHGQSENLETMKKWEACLTKLTDTKPNFSSKSSSEDEAKLVRDITRHVSGLLSESRPHKELLRGKACESTSRMTSWSRRVSISGKSNSLIAMDRQTDSIYEILKLKSTSEVRVIGITGVAGIGKTTIARHLYKKLSLAFEDPCFFEDESSGAGISKSSREDYIDQKLSAACHQNHYSLETSRNLHDQGHDLSAQEELLSPESLKRKATETLRCNFGSGDSKRTKIGHNQTLIIVDDIGIEELEKVMEGVNRLCPGSRVIVTTEDKSLLLSRGVEHVYEMDCLKYDEALELFSECAFQKQYPPANFEQLSVLAVELTGCLPLGLKLLGSFLRDKTQKEWECEIQRVQARQEVDCVKLPKLKAQGRPKEGKECRGSKPQQKEKIKAIAKTKISFFFEEKAFGNNGELKQPKELSINKVGHALHELEPLYKEFTYSSKVSSLVSSFGYRRPVVMQSMYIFKQPGIGGEVVPHQDNSYVYTDPPSCTGLWMALEDSTTLNGCLWAIPGSHKNGLVRRFVRGENGVTYDQPSPSYELKDFVPIEMKAGSMIAIHGDLIHQSFENLSPKSRHAYSLHVVESDGCKWAQDNWIRRENMPEPLYAP